MGGDGGAVLSIISLVTSKFSGMEGSCKSFSWVSLGEESKGTRLDGPLPEARVNSIAIKGAVLQWPDTGCILLKLLHSIVFSISKHPVCHLLLLTWYKGMQAVPCP